MTKSALQIARAAYQPKLPKGLTGTVKAVAGAATQSVADQEEIKKLFPNTYGMPLIKFENTDETVDFPAMNVGVILSGGQAPGGHNVISGIFDGIKKLNKDSKLYGFVLQVTINSFRTPDNLYTAILRSIILSQYAGICIRIVTTDNDQCFDIQFFQDFQSFFKLFLFLQFGTA